MTLPEIIAARERGEPINFVYSADGKAWAIDDRSGEVVWTGAAQEAWPPMGKIEVKA